MDRQEPKTRSNIKTMKTQPIPPISGRRRIKDHVERGKWQRPMRDEWQQPWRVSGNSHGDMSGYDQGEVSGYDQGEVSGYDQGHVSGYDQREMSAMTGQHVWNPKA